MNKELNNFGWGWWLVVGFLMGTVTLAGLIDADIIIPPFQPTPATSITISISSSTNPYIPNPQNCWGYAVSSTLPDCFASQSEVNAINARLNTFSPTSAEYTAMIADSFSDIDGNMCLMNDPFHETICYQFPTSTDTEKQQQGLVTGCPPNGTTDCPTYDTESGQVMNISTTCDSANKYCGASWAIAPTSTEWSCAFFKNGDDGSFLFKVSSNGYLSYIIKTTATLTPGSEGYSDCTQIL